MLQEPGDKKYVDLHIHTNHSDGTLTPLQVLEIASQKQLVAISITDHDCIDAYPYAIEEGRRRGIEVITGVELSSEIDGIDIHILGYGFAIDHEPLNKKLKEMKEARYVRAQKIVANLNRQGIDLRFETVLKIAGEGAIGRPHIAAAMLKEELIYSFREAFDRYIGYESPAYVEKLKMSPRDVFELIEQAGGVPVLAHPGATKVDERIAEFVRSGLKGIEAYHPEHGLVGERYYKKLARKYGLVITGGSDFHAGDHPKSEIGSCHVPDSVLHPLRGHPEQYTREEEQI